VFLSGQAGPGGFTGRPGGFSWRTKPKQNILFERFSAAFTKKVSKVRNINHIQLNHRSPAIAVFHPSTRPRLMQADAGFFNHVQAAKKPGGRPGRLGTLTIADTGQDCGRLYRALVLKISARNVPVPPYSCPRRDDDVGPRKTVIWTDGDGCAVLNDAGTDGMALLQSVPSEHTNEGWTVDIHRGRCFHRPPAVIRRPRPSSGGYNIYLEEA